MLCHGLFGQGKNWTQIAKALATDPPVRPTAACTITASPSLTG